MLRRLRARRSLWAAVALGVVGAPALFGGVAAAPAEPQDMLPPPELDPRATLPPDPADLQASLALRQGEMIADLAPEEYRSLVITAANRHGVDPRLIAAVITVETEWRPDVVGSYGELGLMQILPSTGAWLAEVNGLTEYDLADSETNVDLATWYLSKLIDEYGRAEIALAVYNGGPRAAKNWTVNKYARKVMSRYDQRKAMPLPGPAYPLLSAS